MKQKITKWQKFAQQNPVLQFFKFIYLNAKIIRVVTIGHGGTRKR